MRLSVPAESIAQAALDPGERPSSAARWSFVRRSFARRLFAARYGLTACVSAAADSLIDRDNDCGEVPEFLRLRGRHSARDGEWVLPIAAA